MRLSQQSDTYISRDAKMKMWAFIATALALAQPTQETKKSSLTSLRT